MRNVHCSAAQIRRLWADRSLRTEDIAAQMGISRQCLSYRAKALGLPSRVGNHDLQKRGSDAEFRAMWMAGISVEDMRRHFGYVSHRGVCQRRKHMGLPTRTRSRGKGNGRGWKETITLAELAERRLASAMAKSAAETRAAMRLAEMSDKRPSGIWRPAA